MDKQELLLSIISKLENLKVHWEYGADTDIEIICNFYNLRPHSKKKKIKYQVAAFFNEAEKTIFFWEVINEKAPFAVNAIKVKGTHYNKNGKAEEFKLDLGDIGKIFKNTAKLNEWKFKTVIRREKAVYPPGMELNKINIGNADEKAMKAVKLKPIISVRKVNRLALISSIFIAIVVISLALILGVKPQKNTSSKPSNPRRPNTSSSSDISVVEEHPAFYISKMSLNMGLGCIFEKPSTYDKASIGLLGSLDLNFVANSNLIQYEGDKVNSVTINNFEVVMKPSYGTPIFLTSGISRPLDQISIQNRGMPKNFAVPVLEKQPTNEQPWSNYYVENGTGHINIMYYVIGIGDISGEDKNANLYPSLQKLGFNSANLRSSIAFDIEIETNDKHVFYKHVVANMVDGEFIKDKREVTTVIINNENQPEKMPFSKLK